MNEYEIIGLVVSALVVLVGLFAAIVPPIVKVNKTNQKLSDNIEKLNENIKAMNEQLRLLHNEVDDHSLWLRTDKQRLDNHEQRLHQLDGQVGFTDTSKR